MTSFVGMVNDDEFLIDQTSNRRFATIPLPADLLIDYETQIKPFDALQLWAQVYELVKDKDKASCFRLTEDEKRQLEKRNSSFVKPMKAECEVLDILEEQQTQEQGCICTFKKMTVLQFIQQHNLKYDANVVGKVLKKYGYEAKRKKVNGETVRVIRLPYKNTILRIICKGVQHKKVLYTFFISFLVQNDEHCKIFLFVRCFFRIGGLQIS